MNVGILTGGGDCPGLNAVIRAVVQRVVNDGGTCLGILEGWRGLVQDMIRPLDLSDTDGIIATGGTILGSSRTNPYKNPDTELTRLRSHFRERELDALIVIGGDDTLGVGLRLYNDFGLPIVGIPKTIDNDMAATEFSFGFDTAVNVVTEAVDRLRTTAESHRRIIVVETMGRHSGWIACFSGMAVGADFILVPEVPIDLPRLIDVLQRRRAAGKKYGIVIVSEGARFPDQEPMVVDNTPDPFGHFRLGGIGNVVADAIIKQTRLETRCIVLGHLQRGGSPTAYDRILATRLGLAAARMALQKKFGSMVALSKGEIVETRMNENVAMTKTLNLDYYDQAAAFFR